MHVCGPVEAVAARLDDGHEGDDDEGQQLQHRAHLSGPGGKEVLVSALAAGAVVAEAPVEHLVEAAGFEGGQPED